MKQFLIIALLSIGLGAFAQTYDEASVQTKPQFPGGEEAFIRFVETNAQRVRGFGRDDQFAEIRFVVETDGSLTDLKINFMGVFTEWHKEVLRIMESSPKWKPAKHDGKPVRCKVIRTLRNPYYRSFDGNSTVTIEPAGYDIAPELDENKIYTVVDVQPQFPGGVQKLHAFFASQFKMPDTDGLKGKVLVTFVVEKDGSLSDIKAIRDMGFGTGGEVVRVLKKSPKWTPGQYKGKTVRVQYTMPFVVDSTEKKQ